MKKRISKSLLEQLRALDDHLYLLRKNLLELQKDEAHFKVIAAELRVLVCSSRWNEGLLWRMAEQIDVSDAVELQLAGNVDVKSPFASGLTFAFVPIQRAGFGHPLLPPQSYSLRSVIKDCDAIFITGKGLTHEYLIKAIAQQIGSAHEDDAIELPLATLKEIIFNGTSPYISILILISELVLEVGDRVLSKAEGSCGYKQKKRS